jgi:hypothetical protein
MLPVAADFQDGFCFSSCKTALGRDARSQAKRAGLRSMKLDHYTPLSRAVASIDRDSYAARFAVYDREHKALLRRLATADQPCSDADIAREEQAFRDAIRRIEFAEEDDRPTLVPQHEPVQAAPPEPRPNLIWPELHQPRRETLDVPNLPSPDELEPVVALEPMIQLSEPRTVARRVGERLALAVVALALVGTWSWMSDGRQGATDSSTLRGAIAPTESAASDNAADAKDNTADAKSQQPTWLSPEIFYAPPPMPSASPRADVPLPVPRPER